MELEVSYNERTTASRADRSDREALLIGTMDGGQAVGTDCVDRHTLFITPLSS